jgi:hypothetical protein
VGEAQTATEHLAKMATELRELVGRFQADADSVQHRNGNSPMKAARHAAGRR